MECWLNAQAAERKQFEAIVLITSQSPHLISFLFNPDNPELSGSPDRLIQKAQGFSSGDYLLVKLCIDIWCEQGDFQIHELFNLDPDVLKLTLRAFDFLGAA